MDQLQRRQKKEAFPVVRADMQIEIYLERHKVIKLTVYEGT